MQDAFVETPKGRIHYLRGGSGPPLLLLHSNGRSAREHDGVFSSLCAANDVIAWDMPGQGDSHPITEHWTIADYADAAVALLDGLGIQKAYVAGSSVGGNITIEVCRRHPDRVLRGISVECPFRDESNWPASWPQVEKNFSECVQSFEKVAPRFHALTQSILDDWNRDRSKTTPETMMDAMWAMRRYDLQAALTGLKPDLHMVFGKESPTAMRTLSRWDGLVPPERIHQVADAGHFIVIDQPAAFAEIVGRLAGENRS